MNTMARRNSVILITLVFIAAIGFGILSRPGINTQEITDYLENMAPVAEEHTKWLEDYALLTGLYNTMSQSQKIEELNGLLTRMEEIQTNIGKSIPSDILKHVISKWNDECRLILQALFLLIQGVDRNNIEWISQAYESLSEAEGKRQQWKQELSNFLKENDIEIEATLISVYFE